MRDILRGLYEGRYEPGERLQEAHLTETYKVSRGPVREALNALAARSVVQLVPQCGAQIRVLSLKEAIDTLVVAQTLLGLSARLAAERCAESAGRKALEEALERIMEFSPDADSAAFATARDAFYGAMNAMADNSELNRVLPTVQVHLIRVQYRSVLRAVDARRRADYKRIANAILAGEPAKAERAVHKHLGRAVELLQQDEGLS
ncbi:GntR family transcriptional regulator [Henriciella aquimarina]|uniref:GntR family transcriptional regulator n=1 Tax=Henriciella aquimarina TaxID=545261 RepID=UPI001301CAE3|nr:GntR family transcriptional regulator [Henriciella aquimarina]